MHPTGLTPHALAENMDAVAGQRRGELAARIGAIAHRGVQTAAQHLAALLPAARQAEPPGLPPAGEQELSQVADGLR
jgi:hypothetical protein